MSTLIIAEHDNTNLHSSTYHAVSAATNFDGPIIVLVVGYKCEMVSEQAAKIVGVDKILCADAFVYQNQMAENVSKLVLSIASEFQSIVVSATTFGKNILPRIAALLDITQISDVSKIVSIDTFEHPIYAGNAIETVKVLDNIKAISIRTTAFEVAKLRSDACTIEMLSIIIENDKSTFVNYKKSKSERPELTSARIIVAGGRGLKSADQFKLIDKLADTMGAAVGASRAAVDAGFVPNDYQVGQTGKVVAPMLYVAIGISGAIQHLAGMKDSKVIVAINKDEDAPIMQVADYYLVGDLFEIIPELIDKLKDKVSV